METLIAYPPLRARAAVMVACFRMMREDATAGRELPELKEKVAPLEAERTGSVLEEMRHG